MGTPAEFCARPLGWLALATTLLGKVSAVPTTPSPAALTLYAFQNKACEGGAKV